MKPRSPPTEPINQSTTKYNVHYSKDASSALHGLVTSADTGIIFPPFSKDILIIVFVFLIQVPLVTTPSQQGPIMVSSTRKDEKK